MSWNPPVPDRKYRLLDGRLNHLRGVIKRAEGPTHVSRAAEAVRLAALAIIKTKRALIAEYPRTDPDGLKLRKLEEAERRWLALPIEAIVDAYGADAASARTMA